MLMWGTLISWIFQIILKFIPIFVANKEKQEELKKKIQAEIDKYERGVKDAAKVREEHAKLDQKLKEEWEKKFGTKPTPPQMPETPSEVKVNEKFVFEAALPEGLVVEAWAEKQYLLGTMVWNKVARLYQLTISFNQAGVRVIYSKSNGEWHVGKTVTVRA